MFSLNQVEIENSDLKIIWIQQKKFFSLTEEEEEANFLPL